MASLLLRPLRVGAALLAALPFVLHAQEARELCTDRPGLGTPPCTVDPGRLVVELGLGDWTRERDPETQVDTILAGDALARIGLAKHLEAQVGWTSYDHVRTRDRTTGALDKASGVGDVTLALVRNLRNPDGSGFSIALKPYATLPVGGEGIGAGDWGAGLLAPISVDLGSGLSLGLTPELDAAVDEDGSGRHLAYGSAAGLGLDLSGSVTASAEISLLRDDEPGEHVTEALAGLSAAWQSSDDMQFDAGVNIGINRDSPDRQVYVGLTRRF